MTLTLNSKFHEFPLYLLVVVALFIFSRLTPYEWTHFQAPENEIVDTKKFFVIPEKNYRRIKKAEKTAV